MASLPKILECPPDTAPLTWVRELRDTLEEALLEAGAILVRGLSPLAPQDFRALAEELAGPLIHDNGEHARTEIEASVYTPVFYPPELKLEMHHENAFEARWPGRILFHCVQPSATGGETLVADGRTVLRDLPVGLRERFREAGVRYRRIYHPGLSVPWQTIFGTTEREELEARCAAREYSVTWRGDVLETSCRRPAITEHDVTGEQAFVAQVLHWHAACLPAATRAALLGLLGPQQLPRTCTFGDGTEIADEAINQIRSVYALHERAVAWQAGEVLLVDNAICAHGRNPSRGERRLLIAMGRARRFAPRP